MRINFNKMDLDTVVFFGAGSFLPKKILSADEIQAGHLIINNTPKIFRY